MSMPNIPNLTPEIKVSRRDVINLIITSIGLEEISLAHIVNAEAEKIQFALGTLETAKGAQTFDRILEANQSAKKMLRDVIKKELILGMKFEDALSLIEIENAGAYVSEEE